MTTTKEQRTDTDALLDRIDRLTEQVAYLTERSRRTEELLEEMNPILEQMMEVGAQRLGALEQRGYFAFAKELGGVLDQVVSGYSPEDVRQLGDNVVAILDTVKSVTQPEMLQLATAATNAVQEAEATEPKSLFGVLRASHDEDVRKGLAILVEVLRYIGRGTSRMAAHAQDKRELGENRLAGLLGPKATLPERTAERPPRRERDERETTERPAQKAAPACKTTPKPPPEAHFEIDGVPLTEDGFLVDPNDWSPELAKKLADALDVELTDDHWKLFEWVRADFAETGTSPNIRRITTGSGITTKQLYGMFPMAPGIYTARLAGIPKPAGCI